MSWDAYVTGPTGLIARSGQHIESAGIYGINGVTWAQSGLDNLNTEELTTLNYIFDDPSSAQASGFTLNGQQFALLRVDDETILQARGKNGQTNPLTIQKTNQAFIIGKGKLDGLPGSVSCAVSHIGEYLKGVGY